MIKENAFNLEELLKIGNLVSTLFITEAHYNSELIFQEIQKILDKYGITIPVKLFLNYFHKMSINEKVDIIDYKALEELYRTKEEVNSMLLTAIRKEKQDLINQGKIEGKIEGESIGIEKGKIETAINMIKKGFDNNMVNEITGLSIEKIESLRKNN